MNHIPENHFFQINLSQQGANWLLRVGKIATWVFTVSCLSFILSAIIITTRYAKFYKDFFFDGSTSAIFQLTALVFDVLFIPLNFIQIFYYYQFTRRCKKGIELQNADLFNESFQLLLRNSMLAIVMFVMHLLLNCLVISWHLFVSK